MKIRIEAAVVEIGRKMQEQLGNQQFDSVATTSAVLARARKLQKQLERDEEELAEIERIVKDLIDGSNAHAGILQNAAKSHSEGGRAEPQTIRVKIDWKANKRNKATEEIYSPKAAEVMAEVIERLVGEFGQEVLQKLVQQVRSNRAPLLSRSPERDFGGYQRRQIQGTDWFLLTHNSTSEKIELLKRVCRVLGLTPGSVEIVAEGRFSGLQGT
jgi:hypothetical protein